MAVGASGDVAAHLVRAEGPPCVPVLEGEQRLGRAVAADQRAHDGPDRNVCDGDRPALAFLGDVVERDAAAPHGDIAPLQGGRSVVVIELGVLLPSDPEQAEIDQPDRGRGHPIAVEAAAAEISQRRRPQRGQRVGEPEHVRELLLVALLAPHLVVAVLRPAPAVDARGLDVAQRVGRDPDVCPGRRDAKSTDAVQRLRTGDFRSGGIPIPEPAADPLSGDPRTVRVAAGQPRDRSGLDRFFGTQRTSPLASNDTAPPYRGPPFAGDRLGAGNIYVAERFVVSVLGLLPALGG
jgi:hypothetical protein